MTYIPDELNLITEEETQFRAAVSESTLQRVGGVTNFLVNRSFQEKQWYINGNYGLATMPQTAVDGLTFFQYDATIIDIWMFVEFVGTAGTTEIDLKRATSSGGAFTTIFSTTPKITFTAGNFAYINIGSAIANTVAPVLSVTDVDAGDALRCDIITSQTGTGLISCGIIAHYKPR